jgi:hypothetical protein
MAFRLPFRRAPARVSERDAAAGVASEAAQIAKEQVTGVSKLAPRDKRLTWSKRALVGLALGAAAAGAFGGFQYGFRSGALSERQARVQDVRNAQQSAGKKFDERLADFERQKVPHAPLWAHLFTLSDYRAAARIPLTAEHAKLLDAALQKHDVYNASDALNTFARALDVMPSRTDFQFDRQMEEAANLMLREAQKDEDVGFLSSNAARSNAFDHAFRRGEVDVKLRYELAQAFGERFQSHHQPFGGGLIFPGSRSAEKYAPLPTTAERRAALVREVATTALAMYASREFNEKIGKEADEVEGK